MGRNIPQYSITHKKKGEHVPRTFKYRACTRFKKIGKNCQAAAARIIPILRRNAKPARA